MRCGQEAAISAASQPPNEAPISVTLSIRQPVEELAIEMDEVVDRLEVVGPRRGAEARMRRREHRSLARQQFEETGVRVERLKAVQEDDRPPAAASNDLEIDAADRQPIGARRLLDECTRSQSCPHRVRTTQLNSYARVHYGTR